MTKHKFAEKWTSTLFVSDDDQDDGTFDLTKMNDKGKLNPKDGKHHVNGATQNVGGEATTTSSGFDFLTLTTENGDVYKGVLVVDSANHKHMVIAGKFHLKKKSPPAGKKTTAFDQDDPPWVITKP